MRTGNGQPPATYPIRLPRAFVEQLWRYLTPREKAILPVLEAHRPNIRPGRERIGKMAGLRRSAVTKGITELAGVGLIAREQRRTASGRGFSTNLYLLADLRDPATLRRVLDKLRARRSASVAANAVTGRPRTRSLQRPRSWAQSHHQEVKPNQLKPKPGQSPNDRRGPNGRARDGRSSSRSHDDDALQAKLPDGADSTQIAAVLAEHYGPDGKGRARKQAHHPRMTAGLARRALARAIPYRGKIEKPGAYLGGLVDDELARAKEAEHERCREAVRDEEARRLELGNQIDRMGLAELQMAIDSCPTLKHQGLDPSVVRTDPAFRAELVRSLCIRRRPEAGPASPSHQPLGRGTGTGKRSNNE